jgi:transcription elongation factor Elf1
MTEQRKPKKEPKYKRVIHLNGKLSCQRCDRKWQVVDLNTERKTQICPVCGEPNDTKEAIKRAL